MQTVVLVLLCYWSDQNWIEFPGWQKNKVLHSRLFLTVLTVLNSIVSPRSNNRKYSYGLMSLKLCWYLSRFCWRSVLESAFQYCQLTGHMENFLCQFPVFHLQKIHSEGKEKNSKVENQNGYIYLLRFLKKKKKVLNVCHFVKAKMCVRVFVRVSKSEPAFGQRRREIIILSVVLLLIQLLEKLSSLIEQFIIFGSHTPRKLFFLRNKSFFLIV